MTSVGSPRTYGRDRPQPDPKRMQKGLKTAKNPSSVPYISQCLCQEDPPQGPTIVVAEEDLMKEDETMWTVADLMSMEGMDQDGMIDVVKVSSTKIRLNRTPTRYSRCYQLQETFTNGWAIHRLKRSL